MPPEPIADVLGAVLMLLGIRDTSWLSMKKFLGNRGVKEEILNFDARRIDPQLRAQVLRNAKKTSLLPTCEVGVDFGVPRTKSLPIVIFPAKYYGVCYLKCHTRRRSEGV